MKYFVLFISLAFLFIGLTSCGIPDQKKTSSRPNILFAISDDQSFPHAGAYGCTWVKTPAFDRVAREGLLFNKAYTPNPKCAPSRSCILTGRNSWQLEEAVNHWPLFPEKFKTVTEALTDHGYKVGRTGKGWAPGIARKDGKPRELIGKNYVEHKLTPPAKYISNNDYAENFASFLAEKKEDKPFFFWFGATEPHRAYEFQAGVNKGGKKLEDVSEIPDFWPDSDTVRADMLDYAFEIEHFDHHLGKMLQTLEDQGLLENTLVVVTSDNGMPFPRIKGQMYEYDSHLPLAIMWGKEIQNRGQHIDHYVNFIDLAPTFLEIAGISEELSGLQKIQGRSLTEFFKEDIASIQGRDFVLIGKERHDVGRPDDQGYPVRGIITQNYAYTYNFEPERWPAGNPETGYLNCDGSPTKTQILNERRRERQSRYWTLNFGKRPQEEYYHTAEDPYCLHNLANDPTYKNEILALRERLFESLKKQGDPRILEQISLIESYKYMDEGTTNFYNRFKAGEKMNTGWVNDTDFESGELD